MQTDGGTVLQWQPPTGDAVVFTAMLNTHEPEKDPFASSPADDTAATIRVLRADVAATSGALPKAQDVFRVPGSGGTRYQIEKVTDKRETPFVIYRAKVVS